MSSLFLDTGVLLGSVLPDDAHHEASRDVFARIAEGAWRGVYTSDFVLAEAFNFIRAKVRKAEVAEALVRPVFGTTDAPPSVRAVLRVHSARFAAALARYRQEFRRGLSFTDWTTLVTMEDEGIRDLATFDRGFKGLARVVC